MSNFCLENRIIFKITWKKSKFFEDLPEKSKFLENLPRELEIFQNFAWKNITFFVKLPEKFEISLKFAWKNWFFYPYLRPPRFQTRLTPLYGAPEDAPAEADKSHETNYLLNFWHMKLI